MDSTRAALIASVEARALRVARGFRGVGVLWEDLAQEARLALVEAASRFDLSRDREAWWPYARRRVLGRLRGMLRADFAARGRGVDEYPAPDDAWEERRSDTLWSYLERLGPVQRWLIVRRYGLDGLAAGSLWELSRACGVSVSTVVRALRIIRGTLRGAMEADGWNCGPEPKELARRQRINET